MESTVTGSWLTASASITVMLCPSMENVKLGSHEMETRRKRYLQNGNGHFKWEKPHRHHREASPLALIDGDDCELRAIPTRKATETVDEGIVRSAESSKAKSDVMVYGVCISKQHTGTVRRDVQRCGTNRPK